MGRHSNEQMSVARPGLTGHAGNITPSYSDVLFSTYQAAISPIPPTSCHNPLVLWSQEWMTRSLQWQAEVMRSGKDTPAERCMLPATSCPIPASQPQNTYLLPLPPSWCSPGWRFTWHSGCLWWSEPGSSCSRGVGSSFPSLLSIYLVNGPGHIQPWCRSCLPSSRCNLGEGDLFWVPQSKGVACKDQQPHKPRHVCPLLESRIHQARILWVRVILKTARNWTFYYFKKKKP